MEKYREEGGRGWEGREGKGRGGREESKSTFSPGLVTKETPSSAGGIPVLKQRTRQQI